MISQSSICILLSMIKCGNLLFIIKRDKSVSPDYNDSMNRAHSCENYYGGINVKKIVLMITTLVLGSAVVSPVMSFADVLDENVTTEIVDTDKNTEDLNEETLVPGQYFEDDENYYVIEPTVPMGRTWSQAQNYTITKTGRTYLGRFKKGTSVAVTIPIPHVPGGKVEWKYSSSGWYKDYTQYVTIRVTVKIYRKVDNKYLRTETYTSNTSYRDSVPD